jgi:hypothetical protein
VWSFPLTNVRNCWPRRWGSGSAAGHRHLPRGALQAVSIREMRRVAPHAAQRREFDQRKRLGNQDGTDSRFVFPVSWLPAFHNGWAKRCGYPAPISFLFPPFLPSFLRWTPPTLRVRLVSRLSNRSRIPLVPSSCPSW